MTLAFGTDGVRGVANSQLTPAYAFALGRAAAWALPSERYLIGRDTRRSGSMLEAAFSAGLAADGVEVVSLGVLPTPGVARACADAAMAGAVISASHNPFADNGIKLFAPGGRKLTDAVERSIEEFLKSTLADASTPGPVGEHVGTVSRDRNAPSNYVDYLCSTVPAGCLEGLDLVVDAANGAASAIAGAPFERLGATVHVIHADPDGRNINADCGATHVASLAAAVRERGADLGIALDGDADRCVAVDGQGREVDGDRLIAIAALDHHARGALLGNAVVVTVMANLGFRRAMAEHGVEVVETPVGDRYVLEAMDAGGYVVGGEQSGHIIFRDLATTGDGLLTALMTLEAVARDGRPFGQIAADVMQRLPQRLVNVPLGGANARAVVGAMGDAIAAVSARLGLDGRVLVRPSGTEPLVRIMVEAMTQAEADRACDELSSVAQHAAGRSL